jgi:hypothetical protein
VAERNVACTKTITCSTQAHSWGGGVRESPIMMLGSVSPTVTDAATLCMVPGEQERGATCLPAGEQGTRLLTCQGVKVFHDAPDPDPAPWVPV